MSTAVTGTLFFVPSLDLLESLADDEITQSPSDGSLQIGSLKGDNAVTDNNLHRSLAPISDSAWEQIEEEASRTVKRNLAARRVVDVAGPFGYSFASVTTGHVAEIAAPSDGVRARSRGVLPLVEIRVPFTLDRLAIDDVARGSQDSDWQPVKDAATTIAHTEDRAVFEGYAGGGHRRDRRHLQQPADRAAGGSARLPGRGRAGADRSCGWPASKVRTRWCWTPRRTPRCRRPGTTATRSWSS